MPAPPAPVPGGPIVADGWPNAMRMFDMNLVFPPNWGAAASPFEKKITEQFAALLTHFKPITDQIAALLTQFKPITAQFAALLLQFKPITDKLQHC